MYENLEMYLLIKKEDLPQFVEVLLNHQAIPFAAISDKRIMKKLVSKIRRQKEPFIMPAQLVFTINYGENEILS